MFAGGACGGLVRAALAEAWPHHTGDWPWGTFGANVLACVLLGWWAVRLVRSSDVDPRARPLLTTGICGGLSTFSTLQVELVRMLQAGDGALAAGYASASIAAGLVAIVAGSAAARRAGGDPAGAAR